MVGHRGGVLSRFGFDKNLGLKTPNNQDKPLASELAKGRPVEYQALMVVGFLKMEVGGC